MTRAYKFVLWLALGLWLIGSSVRDIHAQATPPIVLVIDTSEAVNNQARHTDIYQAVEKVVFFMAAHNPVSVISTCANALSAQSPTQDTVLLRAALAQISPCDAFDQARALQTAVTQLGNQTGDVIYLVNGQLVIAGMDESLNASNTALTPMQTTRSCLYVIPIGDASLPTSAPGAIDRDAVQDLVNAAGCGQRYEPQQIPTIASTLLEAALVSQGRKLMMAHGEHLPLFSRATARMNRPLSIQDDTLPIRIDIVWGTGTLDVALQPPSDAAVVPTIISAQGFQSLSLDAPALGRWNVQLSVTQVPANQVAVILFSQGNRAAPPHPTEPLQSQPTAIVAVPTEPPTDLPTATVIIPASPTQAASIAPMVIAQDATIPASEVPATFTATNLPVPQVISVQTTPTFADLLPGPDTPTESNPADTESLDSLILIVGAMLSIGVLALILIWQRYQRDAQNTPAGSSLHSRPTAELPPLPRLVTPITPLSDKRRAIQTHAPVPVSEGFGESQFRQFPALVIFRNGPQMGQTFEVDSSYFTIGRHSASHLRIQDGTVSREHARILFDNAQNLYLIENISQVGTQVNGQFVGQPRPLYSGDLIQVGNIQIDFQLRLPP